MFEGLYNELKAKPADVLMEEAAAHKQEGNHNIETICYKIAAEKGDIDALICYAFNLFYGIGIEENKTEAFKCFEIAANTKSIKAAINCAFFLYKGEGTEQNKEKAAEYLKFVADYGLNHYNLGIENFTAGYSYEKEQNSYNFGTENFTTDYDYEEEQTKYLVIASMVKYANMLYYGDGIPENKAESFVYYKFAAEKGNTNAMNKCGLILLNGAGVIKANREKAAEYFMVGTEAGNPKCAHNYAISLCNGWGVEKNVGLALEYFKIASKNGDEFPNYNCGILLLELNRIEEATAYLRVAANKGNEKAKEKLTKLGVNQ